ncbi:MAG: hypothetical protein JW902_16250 [Syntrophaceae bacterium]|nr:hypothetical protein [Syntrophaceae bacterium]
MKRKCSWCGKELEDIPRGEADPTLISHGVCEDCAFHLLAQCGITLRDYLNKIEAPVFVIDQDNRIIASNERASGLFEKDHADMDNVLCGEVFECEHARLANGCGKTVHCSGCTVRLCIKKTIETGECCDGVPAFLDCSREDTNKVHFLISTQKFGDAVLLKLEDVSYMNLIIADS